MNSLRQIVVRGVLLGLLAAMLGAGALFGYVVWYERTDRIIPGVIVGGAPIGGMPSPLALTRLAETAQHRPVILAGSRGSSFTMPTEAPRVAILTWEDREWRLSRQEVGVAPDLEKALSKALSLGREGGIWKRVWTFGGGVVHGYSISLEPAFREQVLTRQLEAIAREIHVPVRNAIYNTETNQITDHQAGRSLDVKASLEAVHKTILTGQNRIQLVVTAVEPEVKTEDLKKTQQYQIARFRTPILSADAGRVKNITMAVQKISGVVLQPGSVFSFNDVVGPRDATHGWAQAKELYQGEFVLGYGGGICQVSSTLYNSVLLGGLEVKERYHHDRPLQYIAPGRDATVAWQLLDFRFRNSFSVPIMLLSRVIEGSPKQIEVAIYASQSLPDGRVRIEDGDVRYFPPEMVEIMDPVLPENQRRVIDEGYFGIEIKIFRVFGEGGKERRELVSHDRYQPKAGKVKVGIGNAPGSRKLLDPGIQ